MHSYEIRNNFIEITDSSIRQELKGLLQNHQFYIVTDGGQVTRDIIFISKFVTQIKVLDADATAFNSTNLKKILNCLSDSNIKVCFVCNVIMFFFYENILELIKAK